MSSILAALFAVLVGMLAIRPYISYEHQGMVNTEVAATAGQERLISEAAQAYIQQNYTAVEAASTASTPAIITVPMLQTTGFLPTSMAVSNPYGQTWQVQVLQPTAGNLQALVLSTGGKTIPQSQAPAIAAQTGQEGGFIPYAGQYGSASSSTAMGAYGGWSVSMAGYANPGAGHLASLVAFTNGNLQNDYLYRVAVPGQPQLNTMQTNINMGGNAINNASSFATTNNQVTMANYSGGLAAVKTTSGDGKSSTLLSSPNGGTSSIWASDNDGINDTYMSSGPGNDAVVANGPEGYADSADASGTLYSGVRNKDGSMGYFFDGGGQSNTIVDSPNGQNWIEQSANNTSANIAIATGAGNAQFWANSTGEAGVTKQMDLPTNATIGNACAPNGAIAAASSGALLSCVNAVWAANSAFAATHQMGIANGRYYQNTLATPAFIATWCNGTPFSSGYMENVTIYVTTPSGAVLSQTNGQVQEGGSDANFSAAPSAAAIVPPGDDFMVTGQHMSCSLAYTQ